MPQPGDSTTMSSFNPCRWLLAALVAAISPGLAGAQDASEARWFVSAYTDEATGINRQNLIFGIPETDAAGIVASCSSDQPGPAIKVMFQVDWADQPNGLDMQMVLAAPGYEVTHAGKVVIHSSEYAGVEVNISDTDPLWGKLAGDARLTYTSARGSTANASLGSAQAPVTEFINSCRTMWANAGTATSPAESVMGPFTFACDDGSRFAAVFDNSNEAYSVAGVTIDERTTYLINVISGSGSRYANGELELQTKAADAVLTINGKTLVCKEQ